MEWLPARRSKIEAEGRKGFEAKHPPQFLVAITVTNDTRRQTRGLMVAEFTSQAGQTYTGEESP